MPGMNVVRCNGCQMYQVEIQKKAKKWQCKVCGAKQSLMQVFFQGTGKECRLQVQHLNALKANEESESTSDSHFNNNYHNTASQFSSFCDSTLNSMKRTRPEAQSAFNDSLFGITNIIADEDEHLHKKFKFDSSTEELSDSSTRVLLTTSQDKDHEQLENLIESRFAAENMAEDLQNENFDPNSSQMAKRKGLKRFFEISQQSRGFHEEPDHSAGIFADLLCDEEDDCDLQTDVEGAEKGFSIFDKVLEDDQPEESVIGDTKDSIFANLLSESESDTDEAVILSGGNKKQASTESSLEGDKKFPIRQSESEYSIFESNGDMDLSIDF